MQLWNLTTNQWHEDTLIDLLSANRSGMFFTHIPPPSEITKKTLTPFVVTFFTSIQDQPIIHLYSQFSNSRPYQDPQSKWGHLLPQWKFHDIDDNILIDTIQPDYTLIYSNSTVVGITGTAEFYYSDDMPTKEDCPLIIWTTFDTSNVIYENDLEKKDLPSHSNSLIVIGTPFHINGHNPEGLEITRNGQNEILSRYVGVEFPYVITIKGNEILCTSDQSSPIIFDYPQSSLDISNINRDLLNTNTTQIYTKTIWNPETQQFERYDENGIHIGGFVRGSLVSHVSSDTAQISASSLIQYETYFRDMPYVWISNPKNNTLNTARSFPNRSNDCDNDDSGDFIVGDTIIQPFTGIVVNSFNVPHVTEITDNMSITGLGGIFGIAADICYNAWVADSEMDALYKYDYNGNQLSAINLKSIPEITALNPQMVESDRGLTPAGIALDGDWNIWVTLFDYISALKFDNNGNFLFATQPIGAPAPLSMDLNDGLLPLPGNIYKGPQLDPDTDNNVWATYCSFPNSIIVKYDQTGNEIARVDTLQPSATPIDILVDGADNSFWVTNTLLHQLNGNIQHYDTFGVLISSWELNAWPSYLTIDKNQHIWFTYGYNKVGKIDSSSPTITSFTVSADKFIEFFGSDIPIWWDSDERIQETVLGGIACDTRNNIWIINSLENRVYIVDANSTLLDDPRYNSVYIEPHRSLEWYNNDTGSGIIQYSEFSEWNKSAESFGDWSGYRWVQKYLQAGQTITKTISGISNPFEIIPFEQQYCIRRFNESWNPGTAIQDYAFPEHIYNFHNLWTKYIGESLGGMKCDEQSLGRQSYEKIANFDKDHVDIDTAGIQQLYSISKQLDVPIDDYNFPMPANVKRLIDITSVPHHKLWGSRCKCNKHFNTNQRCDRCNHIHPLNVGNQININSYTVTAYEPFLVKYIYGSEYKIITPDISGSSLQYPLSDTSSIVWLTSSQYNQYEFYIWDQIFCNEQTEGIINWSDEYTTLNESVSAIDDWYKDDGIIEKIFTYELYKGLGFQVDED